MWRLELSIGLSCSLYYWIQEGRLASARGIIVKDTAELVGWSPWLLLYLVLVGNLTCHVCKHTGLLLPIWRGTENPPKWCLDFLGLGSQIMDCADVHQFCTKNLIACRNSEIWQQGLKAVVSECQHSNTFLLGSLANCSLMHLKMSHLIVSVWLTLCLFCLKISRT
jgi:hypothetical protein